MSAEPTGWEDVGWKPPPADERAPMDDDLAAQFWGGLDRLEGVACHRHPKHDLLQHARLAVCDVAHDTADAGELLMALGLLTEEHHHHNRDQYGISRPSRADRRSNSHG